MSSGPLKPSVDPAPEDAASPKSTPDPSRPSSGPKSTPDPSRGTFVPRSFNERVREVTALKPAEPPPAPKIPWTARVRDAVVRLLSDYQAQSKYFKWKSWILGSYALIVLVSLIIFLWPENPIAAYARVTRSKIDGRPLVFVRNDSDNVWTRVRVFVNDGWELDRDRLLPNENIDVNIAQFHRKGDRSGNSHAPGELVPQKIHVKCDQGSFEEILEQ